MAQTRGFHCRVVGIPRDKKNPDGRTVLNGEVNHCANVAKASASHKIFCAGCLVVDRLAALGKSGISCEQTGFFMSQTITKGVKSMLAEANAVIGTIPTSEALALVEREDVVLVDLRDPRELEREGRIPGAFHCPRGMRSALAAKTAHDMGLKPVAHIEGGFGAWKKAGGMVDDGSK